MYPDTPKSNENAGAVGQMANIVRKKFAVHFQERIMSPRVFSAALVLVTLVMLVLLVSAAPARAQGPTGPDFSNVNDILQGRRILFPSDDLIVTINDDTFGSTSTTILQTVDDQVNAQFVNSINSNPQNSFFVTATTRMFNLPRDVTVTLLPGQTLLNDQNAGFNQEFINTLNAFQPQTGITTNDFTGDAYTDIAFVNFPNDTTATLNVMTAVDVNDLTQGFLYGTPTTLPTDAQGANGPVALASGDFDGDGVNEIAVAYENAGTYVAIFRPQVTTNAQGQVTGITLQQIGSTHAAGSSGWLTLNAGRFSGLPNSELALAYQTVDNNAPAVAVQPISITPTLNSNQVTLNLAQSLILSQDPKAVSAVSGYLDFFENTEQLVLLVQGIDNGHLNILTFSQALTPMVASTTIIGGAGYDYQYGKQSGLALGNFDQPNTDDNPVTLEIAILGLFPGPCNDNNDGTALWLNWYHVDPTNFTVSWNEDDTTDLNQCFQSIYNTMVLTTGDTQGRSLVLGPPTKLTATKHKQPEVVLDAPPMHVDYVTPASGSQPAVVNMSAVPDGFYSSYQTSVTNQTQSSRQSTTSYTNGVKVSGSFGFKIGDPLVGSVSVKVGASSGWMHKKFIGHQYGEYTSTQFDASTTTGFDDQIWFTEENHNIYLYPVLGQTACPSDIPNCTPAQQVPLVIMFSGPSQQSQASVGGSALEWYQPVHEIGNVFSYPWNLAQLQATHDNMNLLTSQVPTAFQTDSSTTKVFANWSGQSNSSVTSGSVTNISWGASTSITEKAGIFGGIVGNQDFSYNGSKAVNSLNTQTTKLGESTGIGINKPGSFPHPSEYRYSVAPYIFGSNPLSATVQTINLGTTVQTNGILRAAFTADPTDAASGAWWTGDAYPQPDVAVAHPNRWSVQVYTPSAPQPNCIPIATTVRNNDCLVFNAPQSDIWTSQFYWMKGLLITPANANGEGPQISQATAGQEIQLQARVYNNSLTDMSPNSEIVVQFYGQVWDPSTKQPQGDAFLINAVNAPALPGFNSASSNGTEPNWSVVTTTFDTTNYANQNLGFWVVVYLLENGNLAPEMPAHGLTAIPNSLAQAMQNVEPYSNNVGFFKQLFYVAPQNSVNTTPAADAGIAVENVKVSKPQVYRGDSVILSGKIHAAQATDGLSVLFYDGNPNKKGRVFDADDIAYLPANGTDLAKTVYQARACGKHTLFVQVMGTDAVGQATVQVTINARKQVTRIRRILKPLDPDSFGQGPQLMRLLKLAGQSFKHNETEKGLQALTRFRDIITPLRGNVIPADEADTMLALLDEVFVCVK